MAFLAPFIGEMAASALTAGAGEAAAGALTAGAAGASAASGVAGASALAAGIEPALIDIAATTGGGAGGGLLGGMMTPKNLSLLGSAMQGGQQQTQPMQHDLSPVGKPMQGSFADDQKRLIAKSDPRLYKILFPNG